MRFTSSDVAKETHGGGGGFLQTDTCSPSPPKPPHPTPQTPSTGRQRILIISYCSSKHKINKVSSTWTVWGLKGLRGAGVGGCPLTEPGDSLLLPSPHTENLLAMPLVHRMLRAILSFA